MRKKIFYSFLALLTLAAVIGGIRPFVSFIIFSALTCFFIERADRKQKSIENQVLPFFSSTALIVIISSICSSLFTPEGSSGFPASICFLVEFIIFICALIAAALFVSLCFRTGTKTSLFFLMIGLSLFFAASSLEQISGLLAFYFFFFTISRSFIDWLSQRFKFWLLLGIIIGWAYIIGMQSGTLIHPAWSVDGLLSAAFYGSLIRLILAVTVAFALYLPMSLILGSRKTRTKTATSYIFLSIVPIIILLLFLWLNFFLQVGIFELYTAWKEHVDTVQDLTSKFSAELETFLASNDPNDKESIKKINLLCQRYEDFLSLMFTHPAAFVTILPLDGEEPIVQGASRNASLINPSKTLYPQWIERESMAWIFLENDKLLLKGVQFNTFNRHRVFVRLYIPFEYQDLQNFEQEYKLKLSLTQERNPLQDTTMRVDESGYTASFAELLLMINEGRVPIYASDWETGRYVPSGSITFLTPRYLSMSDSTPLYSVLLSGILLASSFMAFIVIIFSSILGYIINRDMRRSFTAIVNGAQHFSSGDFDHRIPTTSKDEYSIIAGALNQMAIGIKEYTNEMIKKELMERELSIASEVQQRIFPQSPPVLKGFEFGIMSKPYGKVGGDYYDFIQYPEGEFGVVVADASGKGMPAALMVSSLNAILHSYSAPENLIKFFSLINTRLRKVATENAYITLVFCLFQSDGTTIKYINAGHPYPLLLDTKNEFTQLIEGGTSLGMFESTGFREERVQMGSGDTIVFVTDGVLETTDRSGEEFGMDRLKETIVEFSNKSAQSITEHIFERLHAFSSGERFADDTTCIVIKKI